MQIVSPTEGPLITENIETKQSKSNHQVQVDVQLCLSNELRREDEAGARGG